jgi:hypothetical protein
MFHMRAIYLGKGWIGKRLLAHWREKDFSGEMLAYWSFLEIRNRQAKYCEQLLLNVFRVHLANTEKTGVLLLAHTLRNQKWINDDAQQALQVGGKNSRFGHLFPRPSSQTLGSTGAQSRQRCSGASRSV